MWHVYLDGEFRAVVRYAEDAAALAAFIGDGTQVRTDEGWIAWWQGENNDGDAGESYDRVARVAGRGFCWDLRALRVAETASRGARLTSAPITRPQSDDRTAGQAEKREN